MQNTHGSTRDFGRAVVVALLAMPFTSVNAQYRRDDRDRLERTVPIEVRRDEERIREEARRRDEIRRRDEERRILTWRGSVEDDTRIYIRAGQVESRVVSGSGVRRDPRVDRKRALPRREGTLRVELLDGRGRVHVLQQPSARNNYTAIVRVKDAPRGADTYRFAAYFDPHDGQRRDDRGGVWGTVGSEARSGDRVLRWTGNVDREVRITVRGTSSTYSVASGAQPHSVGANVERALPRREGHLEVAQRQGRGLVQVIQQPTRYNDFTAVVRVLDAQGSYGYYDFDLIWR